MKPKLETRVKICKRIAEKEFGLFLCTVGTSSEAAKILLEAWNVFGDDPRISNQKYHENKSRG